MKLHMPTGRVDNDYFFTVCGVHVPPSRLTTNLSAVQCPRCIRDIERETERNKRRIAAQYKERKP